MRKRLSAVRLLAAAAAVGAIVTAPVTLHPGDRNAVRSDAAATSHHNAETTSAVYHDM
ncbi:hypothetical protein [Krasilnikovia sp. MM14-A1259]|uniref:hypothetical protein n=1 Tax=Krasilnikovia sp. MM14-A1259 TaxID=3373539 RepID=UPI0038075749